MRSARARSVVAGVYAITDAQLMPPSVFLARAEAALRGGARVLQYRDKSNDAARRLAEARGLRALCARYGALFVVNDDPALARAVAAPALHAGEDDAPMDELRRELGEEIIIGVSCYGSVERAQRAVAAGADYVAFGSFFPSITKPHAPVVDLGVLRQARQALAVPIVAIGGITAANGGALIAAGADSLAIVSALFATPAVEAATRRCAALFADAGSAVAAGPQHKHLLAYL